MRLGILQTGHVPEDMIPAHGNYTEMFADRYQSVDPDLAVQGYAVVDNVFPDTVIECDAWLVTGSKHGVYDDLPWIAPLKTFLCEARAARVPLIGICFGHQIMAEAFGGRAEKSDKGWGCGVHDYDVTKPVSWMTPTDRFSMYAMHQDQVTEIPDDATVLATSGFCSHAMLSYGDPDLPDAISIQPHPEFDETYARKLVEWRTGDVIPESRGLPALATFGRPVDGDAFVRWSLAFLEKRGLKRHAA